MKCEILKDCLVAQCYRCTGFGTITRHTETTSIPTRRLRIKWNRVFKSRTIFEHVVRGALGFGALAVALTYGPQWGWWAALPLVAALIFFRG